MNILYIKALHIIFVVCWFAGLFYLPRLFIYFAEAETQEEKIKEALQKQFLLMQKRLWYGITWPAMILTFIFGFWMIYLIPSYLEQPWMLLKLGFIALLTMYHLFCGVIRKQQENGIVKYNSSKLRMFNEVATVLLFAIVFVVVLKDTFNWIYGILGLVSLIIVLTLAIKIYKNLRQK